MLVFPNSQQTEYFRSQIYKLGTYVYPPPYIVLQVKDVAHQGIEPRPFDYDSKFLLDAVLNPNGLFEITCYRYTNAQCF